MIFSVYHTDLIPPNALLKMISNQSEDLVDVPSVGLRFPLLLGQLERHA